MNESNHPSPEALAAFVDGRLSGDPRAQVMAHLDRCRDCYEVFAETVRFQGAEEPRGRVVRSSRFGAPQWVWWTAAAAAVLVVAIVAPVIWEDLGLGGTDGEGEVLLSSAELAATLGSAGPASSADASGLLAGGFAFAGGAGPREAAFRAGVRLMDLAAAARGLELDGAGEALEGLARLLADAGLDRVLEDDLDAAREAVAEADALALERAVGRLEAGAEGALDPFHLALGKWAEAGRLAAASGETALFRSPAFVGFLEALGKRDLQEPSAEAVRRVEELAAGELGPAELRALERTLGGLIVGAA
jgi:hypothetical protein